MLHMQCSINENIFVWAFIKFYIFRIAIIKIDNNKHSFSYHFLLLHHYLSLYILMKKLKS